MTVARGKRKRESKKQSKIKGLPKQKGGVPQIFSSFNISCQNSINISCQNSYSNGIFNQTHFWIKFRNVYLKVQ